MPSILRRSTRAPILTDRLRINEHTQRYMIERYMEKIYGQDCNDSSYSSVDCDYTCNNANRICKTKKTKVESVACPQKQKVKKGAFQCQKQEQVSLNWSYVISKYDLSSKECHTGRLLNRKILSSSSTKAPNQGK